MKSIFKRVLLSTVGMLSAVAFYGQNIEVDYSKYPDANPFAKGVVKSSEKKTEGGVARSSIYGSTRPDHVNNALRKFYPPVFNQSGGSCGSAQAVGYCMTYDMNAYRNADASFPENQLPTHFTWLHTYAGIDKYLIMNKHGVPNVVDYGGRTYSETFGNQDTKDTNYGYMQGYDKWYRAMFNRTVGGDTFCDDNQATELGREQLKQWLWNHWGDESFYGGGVSGIGVASGGKWGKIPSTPTNQQIGVAGMYCVSSWGKTFDHALSIVGYDDRIEFDLDSNGVYGEKGKDETGAWIICNSWGDGWCNKGFIYCPYKFSYAIGTNTLPLNSGHYTWRKDYEPKRVFKILMDYSHRSEISIAAGIAADTSVLKPEVTETMPFFDYTGDGSKANPAPAVPMLGKWRTKLNYDPMEFGYDVTDLSESYDRTKPLKYFLCIKSKPTAIGSGNIYKLSLMDYEIEKEGLELPARIDTVAILNGGETTLVSVTVAGRQIYEPLNASLSGNRLTWSAPKPSSYDIVRYYIYKGSEKVAEVPSFSNSYIVDNPEATYYVATAYDYKGKRLVSTKSRPARNAILFEPGETNNVLSLTNAALTLPGVIGEKLNEATIEFWIKPTMLDGFNQQIGERWGSFLFSMSKSGQIYCGWDTSNRISTTANTVKVGIWYHVAIVVDRNVMTVYVNGMKKGSCTSDSFSGIPALSAFHIGTTDGLMNAEIDEFRIWTVARTQKEIFTNRNIEVACPSGQSDLLLYYPMVKGEGGEALWLRDMASGNDVELTGGEYVENAPLLNGNNVMESAFFTWGDGEVYAGEPVQFRAASSVNAVAWEWSVPGIAGGTSKVVSPYFTFNEAGDYRVSLSVTNNKGEILDSTLTVTVVSPNAPKADFDIGVDALAEGEMFSFANKSVGANCKYKWSLPGADVEEINSVNAGVTYSHTGVFPVTLTVTNAGGTDKMTKYVTVSHSKPAVAFSVDPSFIMLGETTYLIDETRHSPQEWQWSVTNGVHTTNITGQHTSFTPKHPGIYSVSLTAVNDMGSSELTESNRLIVSNADSRNGLNFTGGQQCVSTKNLFESGTKAFTIEWWMNPTAAMGALGMVTQNDQIKITTDADGEMTVEVGGKSVGSEPGFVVAGEWHHYAVTFSFGMVKFYRNGVLISSPTTRIGTSTTDWGLLTISGGDDRFSGQIDELRIWSKSLSLSVMKGYINAPLADPASLASGSGLVAYYDFNQTGGSVADRSGNGIDLERVGFGPDGDAWGLSRGVFTLDFDTATPAEEDIDADGLTHVYESVAAGKTGKYIGVNGAIRFAIEGSEQVVIYNTAGQCVFNDTVEGVHVIPFDPGIYVVNNEKIRVR